MSAAIVARRYGLDVLVVDEQPTPRGQIWRGVETVENTPRADILGKAYIKGGDIARQFRSSGAEYLPETRVWQIESRPRVFMTCNDATFSVDTSALLLAAGAQESPVPFPGWTLPGVMTVVAGQVMLKSSGQIPAEPVWTASTSLLCKTITSRWPNCWYSRHHPSGANVGGSIQFFQRSFERSR